jgi:hypothetical protein
VGNGGEAARQQAGGGAPLSTRFSNIYENATEFKFQITFKISKEVENL